MKVIGASLGLGRHVRKGRCCCSPTIYQSVGMVFHHTPLDPSSAVTSATLTLYIYAANSTHQDDVTFDIDISPISGKSVQEIWNQDWTFTLLLDGEPVGRVVYHYVYDSTMATISNFPVNLTVYYNSYIYRAERCQANEVPVSGMHVGRHACTATPAPIQ